MAVGAVGQFDYRATLSRTDAGFTGIGLPSSPDRPHPGIVGQQPTIELREGAIILQRRWPDRLAGPVRYKGPFRTPLSSVSLPVGELLHRVAVDGDVLRLVRGGTGDVGLTLIRGGELIAGLGAVEGMLPGIRVHDDPRAATIELLRVRPLLADPQTRVVWLDAGAPGIDDEIADLGQLQHGQLVVAVAGKSADQRHGVFRKLSKARTQPDGPSSHYIEVPERFTNADEWVRFVEELPARRPTDLHVRFTFEDGWVDVTEGDGAFASPWHLFVNRVHTPGIPGALSMVAVVREHPDVDSDVVEDAAVSVSCGLCDFVR